MTGLRLLTVKFAFSVGILKFLKNNFSYYSKKSKKAGGGCILLCKLFSLALFSRGVVLGVLRLIFLFKNNFSIRTLKFIKFLSFPLVYLFSKGLSHFPKKFLSLLTSVVSRGRGLKRMCQSPWAVSPAVRIVAWLEESQSFKIASESQEFSNGIVQGL